MLPLLTSLSCTPAVVTPPRPPVMVSPVLAVTELKLSAVDAVKAFCFAAIADITLLPATVNEPFNTAAPSTWSSRVAETSRALMSPVHVTLVNASWVLASMVVPPPALATAFITLVPATYRGPPITALPEHKMEPETSKDGALTARRNVAEFGPSPSSTVPLESERLRVCAA